MKRILVPTDFSSVADNALEYAIELAECFQSDIYLYHIYSFDKVTYNLEFPKDQQPYTNELKRRMIRTKNKYSKRIEERLFKKSITKVQVFSNNIPLLVLPEV